MSDPLALSSSNLLVVDSDLCSEILVANVLRSSPAAVSHSRTTTLVVNVRRRAAFRAAQSQSFFDFYRLPKAV